MKKLLTLVFAISVFTLIGVYPARAGTLEFDGVPVDITTSLNEDLVILPGAGGNTQIGDLSGTNSYATTNDDLHVTGKLEADGMTYADSGILSAGNIGISKPAGNLYFSGATSATVSTSSAGVGLTLNAADAASGSMNYITVPAVPGVLSAGNTARGAYVNITNTAAHTGGSIYGVDLVTSAATAATEYGLRVGTIWDAQIALLESAGATYYTTFKAGDQAANINYTMPTALGAADTYLRNDGTGALSWVAGGGVTPPAGNDGEIQYNNGGVFGADAGLTTDKAGALTASGTIQGGTLTDGTLTATGGNLTTTGTINIDADSTALTIGDSADAVFQYINGTGLQIDDTTTTAPYHHRHSNSSH